MVDSNGLTGTIPSEMLHLRTSLEEVWLERNNFAGHLDSLATLSNLKILHVHDNNFFGSIETICPLFQLKLLEFEADCDSRLLLKEYDLPLIPKVPFSIASR